MKSIGEALQLREVPKTNINSKRSYIISQFVEEINLESKKPFNASFIAFKVSHLKIPDLEYFFSICRDYKRRNGSFGKCFWGSLKIK